MIRLILLLLLPLLACSETEKRPLPEPEQPVPTITIANRGFGWGWGIPPGRARTIERRSRFWIASDIPMPAPTIILINDHLFRMEEGETETEIVFKKICPALFDDDQPTFMAEIKPAEQRVRHLPYHRGGIHLAEGYPFNPYTVGDKATITGGMWCE